MNENGSQDKKKTEKEHRHGSYMFTTKAYSPQGIMSFILGVISLLSIVLAIILTFYRRGEALLQYGTVLFVCTLFSMTGLALGFYAKMQADKYYLFAYLGIIINLLTLISLSMILYAGAYGL